MAEGVLGAHVVAQFAHVAAVLQLHALADGNHHRGVVLLHGGHLVNEAVHMEGNLRQANHVHAVAVVAHGQRRRRRQPARVAAHDLHQGHVGRAVHRGVPDDLLHHHADVLGRRAVAGGVVGELQVVVDGLRDAHEADVAADPRAVAAELVDGVHAVVAADVEEVLDVVLLQQVEDFAEGGVILLGLGQAVAAGAQEGAGRALEDLKVQVGADHRAHVHHALLQEALDAVAHAVDMIRAPADRILKNTGQAGVDDGCRAAALADNHIETHAASASLYAHVCHPVRNTNRTSMQIYFCARAGDSCTNGRIFLRPLRLPPAPCYNEGRNHAR